MKTITIRFVDKDNKELQTYEANWTVNFKITDELIKSKVYGSFIEEVLDKKKYPRDDTAYLAYFTIKDDGKIIIHDHLYL